MTKIELINDFFNSEGIYGTKIFYGSCIESHNESNDIDCCIISNQTIDKSFINRYKVFLKENNFILDEEVKYEDKLILSDSKIEKAINNVKRLADKVDLKNNYEDVVDRLIVNILTTKVIIFDNEGNYQKFANLAWKEILTRFKKRGGNEFSDFIKIFGINQDYKKYWGYSPKVIDTISNLFYLHSTEDDYLRLLKESVINYPQRVAVYSLDKNITYSELDKISDNFANEFLKSKGQHVIVNYPHTVELIPIIYGILKAGKVYVPVDNSGPETDIIKIRKNFKDAIYISDNESDIEVKRVIFKNHSLVNYKTNKIAYIIHTSGTTGTPKGVCVTRNNLNYILQACQSFAPVSERDCYLFSTRNTFDVSITEIFGFLFNGGSVFVFSVKNKNFYKELPNIIDEYKITHIALSPSVLNVLLKYSKQENIFKINKLKYLIVAGEEFKVELARKVKDCLQDVSVFNAYGPTEATVYATCFNLEDLESQSTTVPIGKPLPGVKCIIENEELLIGGKGITEGYFGDLDKTKKTFVAKNGDIFYHTGDIAEISSELIIFKGRKDSQIQIYGIRVELSDIRNNIVNIINDSNRDIEVLFDNNMLILFYTGKEIEGLRTLLEKKMVSYKVPSRYVNLKKFKLTTNGKIDKKYLLSMLEKSVSLQNDFENQDILRLVSDSVNEVFNYHIDIDEDLIEHGLNSLTSVELILNLEERLNISLDDLNFYIEKTSRMISEFIISKNSGNPINSSINYSNDIKFENNKLINEEKYRFPTFFYAKIYNHLKFKSQLGGKIFLRKNKFSYEEIYHKLSKIEVFNCVLSKDFNEFIVLDTPINISKYNVKNAKIDLRNELQTIVQSSIENNGLLYKFVLLEDDQDSVLHFSIDHSICDAGSIDALERYILGVFPNSIKYSNYINELYRHNSLENTLKIISEFDIQNDLKVSSLLSKLPNQVNNMQLSYLNSTTENIYSEILLYLKDELLTKYNLECVKVNIVYNIRRFGTLLDFSSTIGDLHSGVTFILKKDTDVSIELKRILNYYEQTMFNPKAIGYRNFPNISEEENRIVKCFDDSVLVSVDYLGVVSKQEFNNILDSLTDTTKELNKLNGSKLNVTAYIVDNNLELIMSKKI